MPWLNITFYAMAEHHAFDQGAIGYAADDARVRTGRDVHADHFVPCGAQHRREMATQPTGRSRQ